MLYVSTRNQRDSYTAHRALFENFAPDGGMFVPFHCEPITPDEIAALKENSFSENVAFVLNRFFSRQLNSWDVEFSIGRYPFRLEMLNQRIVIAELWHNIKDHYDHLVSCLYQKLTNGEADSGKPSQWVKIAVEIAVIFGLYGELQKQGIESIDMAVTADDFQHSISAWYARKMGLPINCIICGCNQNERLWDLLQRGEFNHYQLGGLHSEAVQNVCVERLLFSTLGQASVDAYLESERAGETFLLNEEELPAFNDGFFAAVIGSDRIGAVINSIYRTNTYAADPVTAISYAALQDYRAKTGENRHTLILARQTPALFAEQIASAIGGTQEKVKALIRSSKE